MVVKGRHRCKDNDLDISMAFWLAGWYYYNYDYDGIVMLIDE